MILAQKIIEEFLILDEVKRPREAVSNVEFFKYLSRLYEKNSGEKYPRRFSDSIGYRLERKFLFATSIKNRLPGVKIVGNKINADEFERLHARPKGWFISGTFFDPDNPHNVAIEIGFEPVSEEVPKPPYLYHGVPSSIEQEVLRTGLKPRKRDYSARGYIYREPRIYFLTRYSDSDMKHMVNDLEGVTVFRLDTSKFKKFNIFKDKVEPGYPSVYTLTHIPPKFLEVVTRIEMRS